MLTIGKLAKQVGVTADALRYYEREGLLAPASKTEAGYRKYNADAVRRVRFIRQAQQCGFTLSEIQELLNLRQIDGTCCRDVRLRAVEKRLQLEAKIRAARMMSAALDRLIAECVDGKRSLDECPILAALEGIDLSPEPVS
jgi:MerR family Zn(II)-responsive transcriptional regulator of zntA